MAITQDRWLQHRTDSYNTGQMAITQDRWQQHRTDSYNTGQMALTQDRWLQYRTDGYNTNFIRAILMESQLTAIDLSYLCMFEEVHDEDGSEQAEKVGHKAGDKVDPTATVQATEIQSPYTHNDSILVNTISRPPTV